MPAATPPVQPSSLAGAEWLARQETQAVLGAIEAGGHAARVVGGAVRNALLGLPVVDIDIATSAPPERVTRLAESAGFRVAPTGLAHGTVTVIVAHHAFEVTTLRHDVETFGRHATVAFTDDWAADAGRRDFTINALYCDAAGTVLDPLGGLADIAARRVRFIGDARARIREDYLRILRFFRFHAQYGRGALDEAGLAASVAERAGLAKLSGERIRQELVRLLVAPGAIAAVGQLCETGLATALLGLAPRPLLLGRLVAIEDRAGASPDPMLRLAALAVAVEEDARRLDVRLRLKGVEREALLAATRPAARRACPPVEREAKALLFEAGDADRFRADTALSWARSGASLDDCAWREAVTLPSRWQPPRFPLSGGHVLALGVSAGPHVGRILARAQAWWIEAGFPPEAALREQLERLVRAT